MSETEVLGRIILTIVFGGVLGLESETRTAEMKAKDKPVVKEKQRLGGIRTYSVLSLVGGIAGLFYDKGEYILVYLSFFAIVLLILAAYVLNVQLKKAFGLTTEIAVLITFLIGFLTTSNLVSLITVIVILVLLTFFLSQKSKFGAFIEQVQHSEIVDLLKFGIVSVVVLPLLPNETYNVGQIFDSLNISASSDISNLNVINPFQMWLVVVVITGVNLFAYVLSRLLGQSKGILIVSVVGGIISSTSTTIALATKSKEGKKKSLLYAGGAVVANALSFFTHAALLLAINTHLLVEILPSVIAMLLIGFAVGMIMIIKSKDKSSQGVNTLHSSFSLWPAIKFVGLILLITIAIQLIQNYGNDTFLLLVTALSGVTGLDSVTIATGTLTNQGELTLMSAVIMILLANAINFTAKIFYAMMYGDRRFTYYLTAGLGITLLGSIAVFVT